MAALPRYCLILALLTFFFPHSSTAQTIRSELERFRVETIADGLQNPWGIAFLPDGRILVTERPGQLRIIDPKLGLLPQAVSDTPPVVAVGQGGLLDIELHPNYNENGWIYLAFSHPSADASGSMTKIVRGKLQDMRWTNEETIYQANEKFYTPARLHFGCRIEFDRDGYLYFSIGDRGRMQDAQNPALPGGKIHRLHDDGRIPEDNPFLDNKEALPSLYTLGNRNAQGLRLHPRSGELWSTEHGPRGGDELNLIRPGRNYGWPVITYGINYNGTPITDITHKEGMEQPIIYWTPSIAAAGMEFYSGDAFPAWRENIFVAALVLRHLRRVVLDPQGRVIHQEELLKDTGRIRHVKQGPDDLLYVVYDDPGKILRLIPAR